jgi:antitoxin component YwqK of YwqJK toxin-antitoxin module
MLEKTIYANGQKVYELRDQTLSYYFKSGELKARGPYSSNKKEGSWQYFRRNGDLWKEGAYKGGKKHGRWQHYALDGQVEVDKLFDHGVQIRD